MQSFYRINTIAGWLVFAFALIVYVATMEPTASFWDCGEFISAAYLLEIVHPPGSPLHAIVGRVFTLFGEPAWMMNLLSALSSAFCILFTFWSVTYLSRKAIGKRGDELSQSEGIAVIGSGAIAGLAGTFLDSFWFSAAEAEVYAFSAFFTFAMIWAMLKWDYNADKPYSDRWLVLIALLTGLGVGVHLLHLLVIPALAYIYYFRRYDFSWKGFAIAFVAGFGLTAFVLFGVLDYFVRLAAKIDYLFVNNFGLPLTSGFFFFLILVFGLGIYAIYYARQRNIQWLQLSVLSFLMVIIGFSSYTMVMLRSNANTPINMNEPKDPYTLHSYLKREQYGSRPLIYGPYFTAQPYDAVEVGDRYRYNEQTGTYEVIGKKVEYAYKIGEDFRQRIRSAYPNYSEGQINAVVAQYQELNRFTLFPRMGSTVNEDHARQYRSWLDMGPNENPDFGDNISFFIKYQLGYMYWRYFMWNFAGRQDDLQGHIDRGRANGNWISGISFIDNARVGYNLEQPDSATSDARNKFYLLPLILGLIGFFYHIRKDSRMAWVVFLLFLFTGIMNIVNSNQPPSEPRERDYAVAISFVVFAFWIGMGVMAIYEWLKDRKFLAPQGSAFASIGVAVAIPLVLGWQGWDDHNRSNRTLARDSAIAYLESVAPNAILFTQGDNDTYPLWYLQEVEGIRNDVRVVNLSLLAVDWYVDQLHNKINEADPVKLRFTSEHYMGDMMLNSPVEEDQRFIGQFGYDLNKALDYVKMKAGSPNITPDRINLPISQYVLPLDTAQIRAMNILPANLQDKMVTQLRGNINKRSLIRDEMIILDILASNFPERPIYFSVTVDRRKHMGLSRYLQREGLAWRLVPADPDPTGQGREFNNADIMYDNMVGKWQWGGLDSKDHVYLDETAMRTAKMLRGNMIFLAQLLQSEGKRDKAKEVLDLTLEKYPLHNVPFTAMENLYPVISTYLQLNDAASAKALANTFLDLTKREMKYYYAAADLATMRMRMGNVPDYMFRLNQQQMESLGYAGQTFINNISIINTLINQFKNKGETDFAKQMVTDMTALETDLSTSLLDPALREL